MRGDVTAGAELAAGGVDEATSGEDRDAGIATALALAAAAAVVADAALVAALDDDAAAVFAAAAVARGIGLNLDGGSGVKLDGGSMLRRGAAVAAGGCAGDNDREGSASRAADVDAAEAAAEDKSAAVDADADAAMGPDAGAASPPLRLVLCSSMAVWLRERTERRTARFEFVSLSSVGWLAASAGDLAPGDSQHSAQLHSTSTSLPRPLPLCLRVLQK